MNLFKRISLLSIVLTGIAVSGFAQAEIKANDYVSAISESALHKHLSVLASDEYEGRETGKQGQKMAAEYIAGQFKSFGLTDPTGNNYRQTFQLTDKVLAEREFVVNQQKLTLYDDFYFQKDMDDFGIQSNEIYFAGYGISNEKRNDFGSTDIKGKVVMVMEGEPKNKKGIYAMTGSTGKSKWSDTRTKVEFIRSKDPALIILVSNDFKDQAARAKHAFAKGNIQLAKKDKGRQAPVLYISREAADALLQPNKKTIAGYQKIIDRTNLPSKAFLLKSTLRVKINFINSELSSENIIGYVEGDDLKDEYLILTAHYDHLGIINGEVYNGADDNASGTSALIELARAFSTAANEGIRPRRSVVFIAFSGEEKGLLGSRFYAQAPAFPFKQTITNLNIDMIGRIDKYHEENQAYIYIIGSDKLSSELHEISEIVNKSTMRFSFDYTYNKPDDPNRFYYRSDHYYFAKHNVPVIFYFNGLHDDYHKDGDEIDKINFPILQKRTQLIFYTAWELAFRAKRPVVDKEDPFLIRE